VAGFQLIRLLILSGEMILWRNTILEKPDISR
jgi:hypothetical protein